MNSINYLCGTYMCDLLLFVDDDVTFSQSVLGIPLSLFVNPPRPKPEREKEMGFHIKYSPKLAFP